MRAVGPGVSATLSYDPLGRLWKIEGSGVAATNFVYDGDALVLEYGVSSGAVTNRYIHGPNAGADDPLVEYIGATVNNSARRWLHADRLGSIIARVDNSGGNPVINRYDEYGMPASGNAGRFQYTGQAWLNEIGLYYYKARMYAPGLGRFLQTDPVGYEGGINLYVYVGNDPLNMADTFGLVGNCTGSNIEAACDGGAIAGGNSGSSTMTPEEHGENQKQADRKRHEKEGLKEAFKTMEASAGRMYEENREPGGYIYADEGQIGSTPTEWGPPCKPGPGCSVDVDRQLQNVPQGAQILFEWHGHGRADSGGQYRNFSDADRIRFEGVQRDTGAIGSLLLNPHGYVKIIRTPYGPEQVIGRIRRPWLPK